MLCGRSLERRAFWIESEGDFELDSTKVEACLLSTVIAILLMPHKTRVLLNSAPAMIARTQTQRENMDKELQGNTFFS